jgi:hypothetical protein
VALVGIESVCEDVAANPPPSPSDYAVVSSVITAALGGTTPTATFSVTAASPTTIQGTTITTGTVTTTIAPIVIQSQTKPVGTKTTSKTSSPTASPTKNAAAARMEAGAAVMGGAVLAAAMML